METAMRAPRRLAPRCPWTSACSTWRNCSKRLAAVASPPHFAALCTAQTKEVSTTLLLAHSTVRLLVL